MIKVTEVILPLWPPLIDRIITPIKIGIIQISWLVIIGKKTKGDLLEFKETGGETQNLSLDKIIEILTKQKASNSSKYLIKPIL